jgi:antitoxin (DNA-binding transcriptional repressor) of toxin-antitoxin stability system
MSMSLTYLRSHLYKIVDEVIDSGVPVEIERHGQKIRIMSVQPKDKLNRLKQHKNVVTGDSDELVHFDWSNNWDEKKNL